MDISEPELTEAEAQAVHDWCCYWIDALNAELDGANDAAAMLAGFMAAAEEVWEQHMPTEH